MKDWLGKEYTVGDTVIYAAGSGRSITMVVARVLKFTEKEHPYKDGTTTHVQVLPIRSSRWKQHGGHTKYIDTRTGKGIDPWAGKAKHMLVPGHEIDTRTGQKIPEDNKPYNGGVPYEYRKYVYTVWQPWVKTVKEGVKPVTLTVTENITKWEGEIPDDI